MLDGRTQVDRSALIRFTTGLTHHREGMAAGGGDMSDEFGSK